MKCLGSGNAGNRDEENFKKDILNPEVRYSSGKKKKEEKKGKKGDSNENFYSISLGRFRDCVGR